MIKKLEILQTDVLHEFLESGGKLQYRPIVDGESLYWELWGRRLHQPDWEAVFAGRGAQRVFKSANALLAFHLRMFPDDKGVFISPTEPSVHSKRKFDKPSLD